MFNIVFARVYLIVYKITGFKYGIRPAWYAHAN